MDVLSLPIPRLPQPAGGNSTWLVEERGRGKAAENVLKGHEKEAEEDAGKGRGKHSAGVFSAAA